MKERPYTLGLDSLSSYSNTHDIERIDPLDSQQTRPHRTASQRRLAPLLQLDSQNNQPQYVQSQIQDTYTPGYVPDYVDQQGFYPPFPNLTPTTAAPSILEEGLGSLASISCQNFVGQGRHEVHLHCDWEIMRYAEDFRNCVNSPGYRAFITEKIGVDSAL